MNDILDYTEHPAFMAEWLRRLTRNQMASSRAGSNPADCEKIYLDLKNSQIITYERLAYSQFHSIQSVKKVNRNDKKVEKSEKKKKRCYFLNLRCN